MAIFTLISWCHSTINFWTGCDKVSPECAHCYIFPSYLRKKKQAWGEVIRTKTWSNPLKWERKCIKKNICRRVFASSLTDFFHVKADKWRDEAWAIIRSTPHLTYLILTKRPELISSRLPADWPEAYPNVWLGTTAGCNQSLGRLDTLRKIKIHPKAHRFLSAEPLMEDISANIDLTGFSWVIVGGESGSGEEYQWDPKANWREEFNTTGRRTMKLEWARSLQAVCKKAGIAFWFKQITSARPGVGGDALGQTYHEVPEPHMLTWGPMTKPAPKLGFRGFRKVKQLNRAIAARQELVQIAPMEDESYLELTAR